MLVHDQKINQDTVLEIRTGDVLLVKSKIGFVSKVIKFLSGSNFIHSAILVEIKGLWFVIETRYSKRYAYQMMPIEWWLARHPTDDAYIGRMPDNNLHENSEAKIRNIVMDSVESTRPYKMRWLALVYLLQVWLGVFRPELSKLFRDKPLICSTLVQEAWERAGLIARGNYMTPADVVAAVGGEKALVPLHQHRFVMRSKLREHTKQNVQQVDISDHSDYQEQNNAAASYAH